MVKVESVMWESAAKAKFEYSGLSTDSKPTEMVSENSLFLELDTGDLYYYTGSAWAKFGGNG